MNERATAHPMGAEGLARAHYRPATSDERCASCAFFETLYCRMFGAAVSPDYVCDEWASIRERTLQMNAIEQRAVWSTAYVNDLPDSAFLYIEDGGEKDDEGKTKPRTLRHFPYKDANGNVDLPHLRNALARIPQSNLPTDVKERLTKKAQQLLSDKNGDDRTATIELEYRYAFSPIEAIDVRDPSANEDGTWTMSGYAAVFNRSTTLYDGRLNRVTEIINPRALDRVLREQDLTSSDGVIRFTYEHDLRTTIAATDIPAGQPGSLQLRTDRRGMFFLAKVDREDDDARQLAVKMRNGLVKQASWSFQVAPQGIEISERRLDDGRFEEHREILDVAYVRDVCATPAGAYGDSTTAQLRSMAAAYGQPTEFLVGGQPRQPDLGGESLVSPILGGGAARRTPLDALIAPGQRKHLRRER